ncbi:MAG: SRPBCC family protein [Roseiflexaceae bacterium]
MVSTRVFNAPRESVFRAFSDPHVLALWWGPKDFTNTFQEFDLRPGGAWRFVMHGPDGAMYQMAKEFIEVVPAERIILLHPDPQHRFLMTITFAEEADTTRLTWRMRFESAAEFEKVSGIIPAVNEQNFDRLEAQLATMV